MNAENEFERWWHDANDGANTKEKDASYPMAKELAKAVFLAALAIGRKSGLEEAEKITMQPQPSTTEYCCLSTLSKVADAIRQLIEETE